MCGVWMSRVVNLACGVWLTVLRTCAFPRFLAFALPLWTNPCSGCNGSDSPNIHPSVSGSSRSNSTGSVVPRNRSGLTVAGICSWSPCSTRSAVSAIDGSRRTGSAGINCDACDRGKSTSRCNSSSPRRACSIDWPLASLLCSSASRIRRASLPWSVYHSDCVSMVKVGRLNPKCPPMRNNPNPKVNN